MEGQFTFDGRELSEIRSGWSALELDSVPDGLTREQLADLTIGDEATCACGGVRFHVEAVSHDEKVDRYGVGTKPLRRKVQLKLLSRGFRISVIEKRDDLQAPWAQDQGATA